MAPAPILVVDCYVDERDGAENFLRHLGDEPTEVRRANREPVPVDPRPYAGVIVTGSAASWRDPEPWMAPLDALCRATLQHGVPYLGVCFGHQALAAALHGRDGVRVGTHPEIGWYDIEVFADDPLLSAIGPRFRTFQSHFDEVPPDLPGTRLLARSATCANQAFRVEGRPAWGVQFHCEMAPAETHRLVATHLGRHPELGRSAEDMLELAVDSAPLADAFFPRFAALARGIGERS